MPHTRRPHAARMPTRHPRAAHAPPSAAGLGIARYAMSRLSSARFGWCWAALERGGHGRCASWLGADGPLVQQEARRVRRWAPDGWSHPPGLDGLLCADRGRVIDASVARRAGSPPIVSRRLGCLLRARAEARGDLCAKPLAKLHGHSRHEMLLRPASALLAERIGRWARARRGLGGCETWLRVAVTAVPTMSRGGRRGRRPCLLGCGHGADEVTYLRCRVVRMGRVGKWP